MKLFLNTIHVSSLQIELFQPMCIDADFKYNYLNNVLFKVC